MTADRKGPSEDILDYAEESRPTGSMFNRFAPPAKVEASEEEIEQLAREMFASAPSDTTIGGLVALGMRAVLAKRGQPPANLGRCAECGCVVEVEMHGGHTRTMPDKNDNAIPIQCGPVYPFGWEGQPPAPDAEAVDNLCNLLEARWRGARINRGDLQQAVKAVRSAQGKEKP